MRLLTPGQNLFIRRDTMGLGADVVDVSLLKKGVLVRYVRPAWLEVELSGGSRVDVHIDSLEFKDGE